ncbi:hypothetical protein [Pseudomonas guariconensis]|nr:hypothetical protein [Pseudomonas guariconensis]MBF8743930.1 hypothetical protein [Pseudomonas guariconensis]MBF8753445.1 hypothetical protein [Pseudomonas guariconensis]
MEDLVDDLLRPLQIDAVRSEQVVVRPGELDAGVDDPAFPKQLENVR